MSYKDWNAETLLDYIIARAGTITKPREDPGEDPVIIQLRAELLKRLGDREPAGEADGGEGAAQDKSDSFPAAT